MPFRDELMKDLQNSFFNVREFGEIVELTRNGSTSQMRGLFDAPSLDGSSIGAEIDAISHQPRLFVSSDCLPGKRPEKGDVFFISESQFHESKTYEAVDFAMEKDGVVVYKLRELVA